MKKYLIVSGIFMSLFLFAFPVNKAKAYTWTPQLTSSHLWNWVSSSADGTKMMAADYVGYLYYGTFDASSDSWTWTQQSSEGTHNWKSVSLSSDGTRLIATGNGDYVYTAHYDTASSAWVWNQETSLGDQNWYVSAISGNGMRAVVEDNAGYVYTGAYSTSTGTWTWTTQTSLGSGHGWYGAALSSDGTKLAVVGFGDSIYTAVLGTTGTWTWTTQTSAGTRDWDSIAASADGTKLVAVDNGGYIYTGVLSSDTWTWTAQTSITGTHAWKSIASSADGTRLIAADYTGGIYTGINSSGTWTWTLQSSLSGTSWKGVSSSSSGTKLAALGYGSYIYVTDFIAVATNPATPISSTTETLNGTLTSMGGFPTTVSFAYGPVASGAFASTVSATPSLISSMEVGGVPFASATPITVSCGVPYQFEAIASNTGGDSSTGSSITFTDPCPIVPPTVETTAATPATSTTTTASEVLEGTLTDVGYAPTTVGFSGFSAGTLGAVSPATISTVSVGGVNFYATLSGLACSHSYAFNATASNSAGSGTPGATVAFTTAACLPVPPVVATNAATTVTADSAVLNGTLSSTGGISTAVNFSGFSAGTLGTVSPASFTTVPSGGSTFSAPLTGLTCGTTYSFHASATNAGGTVVGSTLSFTTSTCSTVLPSVSTTSVTLTSSSSATLSGKLTATGGGFTTVSFSGFSAGTLGTVSPASFTTVPSGGSTFSAPLTGLTCGTTYIFRATATNSVGMAYGTALSFTPVCPVAPTVITLPATGVTLTGGTENGKLVSLGGASSVDVGFMTGGAMHIVTTLTAPGTFSYYVPIACGSGGSSYYLFTAYGTNSAGTGYGTLDMSTFPTGNYACPLPTVVTNPATSITATSATINGTLTSTGGAPSTLVGFVSTFGIASLTPSAFATVATSGSTFSATAVGLTCGTTYSFRATANNQYGSPAGEATGVTLTFTTTACPPPVVYNAQSLARTQQGSIFRSSDNMAAAVLAPIFNTNPAPQQNVAPAKNIQQAPIAAKPNGQQ